ncbi:hypothetical protein OAN61_00180 [bacterium]|nr:hypothetical protein [bacterium]
MTPVPRPRYEDCATGTYFGELPLPVASMQCHCHCHCHWHQRVVIEYILLLFAGALPVAVALLPWRAIASYSATSLLSGY